MTRNDSTQALILAGGLGTRLRSVHKNGPKCLAPVAGRPFLEYLIERLARNGIRRIVLCIGHRKDQILEHFGDGRGFGVDICYSVEDEPLGTAGALRKALPLVSGNACLVLNGDSYLAMSYAELVSAHERRAARATIAVVEKQGTRYGTVEFDSDLQITHFGKRRNASSSVVPAKTYVNGGVYAICRDALNEIPTGQCVSIEQEFFPAQIGRGFFAHPVHGYFIDIGIPADFYRAGEEFTGRLSDDCSCEGPIAS